jgi:hypothetical protein
MSTKNRNIINPDSCWNKAADDEPVFVLRAKDPLAHAIVVIWANRYMFEKGGWDKMTEAQRNKFSDALCVATDMREWRLGPAMDIPF